MNSGRSGKIHQTVFRKPVPVLYKYISQLYNGHTENVFAMVDVEEGRHGKYGRPLPILMGYGKVTEPGEWLGDIIDVSDSRPERYSLID